MPKNKKNLSNKQLEEIIFAAIFEVADDETGNSSYRKYFDKVVNDIFGLNSIITTFMMTPNQFKSIHKMMKDPELKQFCQMMLSDKDIKIVKEMVRVAYDAAQIALKPKKSVSSGDIKAYRYLTKLYTEGIKTLRKKYGQSKSEKKKYKDKYSTLSSMLGDNKSPDYSLSFLSDIDDDYLDIFDDEDEDDEDEDEDVHFSKSDFDLDDLPSRFMVSRSDLWEPPVIKDKVYYPILNHAENEDNKKSDDLIMPEGEFQRYALSIFEKLLQGLEKKNEANENSIEDKEATDMEEGIIPDSDPEVSVDDTSNSEIGVTNDLVNRQTEESVLPSTIMGTSEDSVILTPKDYQSMTREECINEFNKNSGVMPNVTSTTESK